MVKERDINNIEFNSNGYTPLKKNKTVKNVIGFDTETRNGKCFLIAYFNTEDDKEIKFINNFDDVIEFLFSGRFRKTINFFYNINYDFQAIIKHLPIKYLKELAKMDRVQYKDYRISVIPNKSFIIENNNHTVKFFDLAQFYNFIPLKKAGIKYLNMKKENLEENEIDIKNLEPQRYNTDFKYKFYLDKYLIMDVRLTKHLGQNLYSMMSNYLIPKSFYSQASFSQQYFLENLKFKTFLPPKCILQYGLNAYQGGRFEVFKRGFFNKAYIQDIKSAYPYHNKDVPEMTKGEWKKNKDYEPESLISLFKINTVIHDIKISPLKYQLHNNLMIYPIGNFKDVYVNKKEIELLNDLGYKYKIQSAYHYFDDEPEYPFRFLEKFYYEKEELKRLGKEDLSWTPKILMNGFYGKMIQLNPKLQYTKTYQGNKNLVDLTDYKGELIYVYKKYQAGKLFNPIVANEITANTRVQLFRSSFKDMNKIIGFQTDSIISEKKLSLDYSNKLGSWEMEKEGSLVILGSGLYQMLGENPKKKLRGFQKNLDLFNILKTDNLHLSVTRNIKLKKIMKAKRFNNLRIDDEEKVSLFNQIIDETKQLNLNFDRKRVWDRDFINSKDVLENQIDSVPIEI